jgi:hypothetical protein
LRWRCGVTPNGFFLWRKFVFDGITLFAAGYAEIRMTITDRNAGYAGLKLGETNFVFWGVTLRIIWHRNLRAIWHNFRDATMR